MMGSDHGVQETKCGSGCSVWGPSRIVLRSHICAGVSENKKNTGNEDCLVAGRMNPVSTV